jgi:ankyrin repeat protein
VNVPGTGHSTLLQRAIHYGALEIARLLLENGADVGAKDHEGRTLLEVSLPERRDEVAKLLVEYGPK